MEVDEETVNNINNKRKRGTEATNSTDGFAVPKIDKKKMKCDLPTITRHEGEEEEEKGNPKAGDSQSQSESELEGFVAPPSSPRNEDSQSQEYYTTPDHTLFPPRSPRAKRPLTPQNSSTNLNSIARQKKGESDLTNKLLAATREALANDTKNEDSLPEEGKYLLIYVSFVLIVRNFADHKPSRRATGYVHTPLTAEEKLLKVKKQDLQSVISPEYWRKVCPKLHVLDRDFAIESFTKFAANWFAEDKASQLSEWEKNMFENGYYEVIEICALCQKSTNQCL